MKTLKVWLMLAVCLMGLAACSSSDDEPGIDTSLMTLKVSFVTPSQYDSDVQLSNLQIKLTDINTKEEKTYTGTPDAQQVVTLSNVAGGYYRVNVTGKMSYKNQDLVTKTVDFVAYNEGIMLTKDYPNLVMNVQVTSNPNPDPADLAYNGFVLGEIFCAGSANAQGNYYYADKYFVIYNNTDHVLYADSLVIAESDFMTTMKQTYTPDIMNEAMAVSALYMIPGNGRDVPVQPGGKLLIVDNAVNHTVANPNSWDLTTADYEWYDESTNPNYTDVDNPNVPNLERLYSKTLTMWSPHTQGFKAYALARMHTDKKTFLVDYIYDYAYHLVGETGESDMTGTCYKLPNSWILDAVNMSTKAGFQWLVTSPALDRGFTYNSNFNFDDSRFGKSVRRKVVSMDGNRAVLQDTNNSTDDFEPRVQADPFHVFGLNN